MKTPRQIESLFDRYPMLAGFSVCGAGDIPDDCSRTGAEDELFIGDIGIPPALDAQQCAEILREITAALAELISDEPESGEHLRGRTFARVLH